VTERDPPGKTTGRVSFFWTLRHVRRILLYMETTDRVQNAIDNLSTAGRSVINGTVKAQSRGARKFGKPTAATYVSLHAAGLLVTPSAGSALTQLGQLVRDQILANARRSL
jgi:hypothetical protein